MRQTVRVRDGRHDDAVRESYYSYISRISRRDGGEMEARVA